MRSGCFQVRIALSDHRGRIPVFATICTFLPTRLKKHVPAVHSLLLPREWTRFALGNGAHKWRPCDYQRPYSRVFACSRNITETLHLSHQARPHVSLVLFHPQTARICRRKCVFAVGGLLEYQCNEYLFFGNELPPLFSHAAGSARRTVVKSIPK